MERLAATDAPTEVEALDSGATVAVAALAPFVRLVEEAGADVVARIRRRAEGTFARWGIALDDIAPDPALRLPHGLVIALHEDFVDELGDPSAPLRAGLKLQLGDYELLEYLCGTCATLGESIACLGRYYPLLISAEHDLVVEGDRAEARFRITPGLEAPDSIHEFAIASNLVMTALHLQLDGAQMPIEVCFAHAAPAHADLFPQIFPAPVRFGCEHNAIVFGTGMLAHPMRTADALLHSVLTRLADQELAALSDRNPFCATVREMIESELERGAPLDAVAERLHISASALRSRLRQHGTSYSALFDRLRREHARRALRQTHLSFAEIAHKLGFAHPPAFHRAVRRWFGVTPSAYRESTHLHPSTRFWRRET